MDSAPLVSFIIATRNRRDVLLRTLAELTTGAFPRNDCEIIVVDNASEDGTPQAVGPLVDTLLRLDGNDGSCAKAHGVSRARGAYVVFLDDDSYPTHGTVARMVSLFEQDPRLGAAGCRVILPDGREECSALPGVFVGCGVGLRADALRAVGGLDRSFFMQAEEYDLAFRLAQAGWRVDVFGDLAVRHGKTAQARRSDRTTYYDIRNNLRVAARYLPTRAHAIYRDDWRARYRWLAEADDHTAAFSEGCRDGRRRARIERWTHRHRRLSPRIFERFFGWAYAAGRMQRLRQLGIARIVLAGLGKNLYAFVRGAAASGLELKAIADDRFCAADRRYRGVPVVTTDVALSAGAEALVIGDTSYVHALARQAALAERTDLPLFNWFSRPRRGTDTESCSTAGAACADVCAAGGAVVQDAALVPAGRT